MDLAESLRNIRADDTSNSRPDEPCLLVVFGAASDTIRRQLLPALYNLASDGLLPERFAVVGVGRSEMSDTEYRDTMSARIAEFTIRPQVDPGVWEALARRLHYLAGRIDDAETCAHLARLVARLDGDQFGGNIICYLAVPPSSYPVVSENLHRAGFNQRARGWSRLIIQEPIGPDLASTASLNRALLAHWQEDQIYRFDRYLGSGAVWNVLEFRFGYSPFEPHWNKDHVDHIQFTLLESARVESRGAYFEQAGLQENIIQILTFLTLFCMDRPTTLSAEEFRNERVRVMRAVRRWSTADVSHNAVRGQYGASEGAGIHQSGYREGANVSPSSAMETFAAIRLFIDNQRWHGVPVYIRTGKAASIRADYAVVEFKSTPKVPFQNNAVAEVTGNRLLFQIGPGGVFPALRGTGHERVILSCMKGDLTPFIRTDLVEAACNVVQPIRDAWAQERPNFPNYAAGTAGPPEAADLLTRDGRSWVEIVSRDTQGPFRVS